MSDTNTTPRGLALRLLGADDALRAAISDIVNCCPDCLEQVLTALAEHDTHGRADALIQLIRVADQLAVDDDDHPSVQIVDDETTPPPTPSAAVFIRVTKEQIEQAGLPHLTREQLEQFLLNDEGSDR
jgi:hypothetical protein